MSQTTLDDDELFGEAANEIRTDVEASLDTARESLPDTESIWTVEADNSLGVLNALHSSLETGDAATHLRDAKKWYTMGKRADAFDDSEDLDAEIERLETIVEDLETAHEQVGDLTRTIPELRNMLESVDTDEERDASE